MNDYFSLVSNEFEIRSKQVNEFIKNHNPSRGDVREIILRRFLKDYIPKWFSVGHGFILGKSGEMSSQCDVIIYNSSFYAPLYSVDDLVIVPPESVVMVIEVKTKLSNKIYTETQMKFRQISMLNNDIYKTLFVYEPPTLETTKKYISSIDYSQFNDCEFIDEIIGLTKYGVKKIHANNEEDKKGICYLYCQYKEQTFEAFYYNLYQHIESKLNNHLKKGINIEWTLSTNEEGKIRANPNGRLGYVKYKSRSYEISDIIKELV